MTRRPGRVTGGTACSSRAIRARLCRRKIQAAIARPAGQVQDRLDRGRRGCPAARLRRQHRAVATRHGRRDHIRRGTVGVDTIRIWLRHPAT